MLTKRIVACLDVKDGKVVKGTRFRGHEVVGEILDLSRRYRDEGVDELVSTTSRPAPTAGASRASGSRTSRA
jgi:imidazole glycerol phosphate synthase subunit HisF